jgi:hypothetical protein
MTFATEEARQILSRDASGQVLVSRERSLLSFASMLQFQPLTSKGSRPEIAARIECLTLRDRRPVPTLGALENRVEPKKL